MPGVGTRRRRRMRWNGFTGAGFCGLHGVKAVSGSITRRPRTAEASTSIRRSGCKQLIVVTSHHLRPDPREEPAISGRPLSGSGQHPSDPERSDWCKGCAPQETVDGVSYVWPTSRHGTASDVPRRVRFMAPLIRSSGTDGDSNICGDGCTDSRPTRHQRSVCAGITQCRFFGRIR